MKRLLMISGFVMALGLGLMACSDDDDGATCSSALNHFYDQGCTMLVSGSAISRSDAIDGCNEETPTYRECGCGGVLQDVLDCFESIGQEQCEACDPELNAFNACISGC